MHIDVGKASNAPSPLGTPGHNVPLNYEKMDAAWVGPSGPFDYKGLAKRLGLLRTSDSPPASNTKKRGRGSDNEDEPAKKRQDRLARNADQIQVSKQAL